MEKFEKLDNEQKELVKYWIDKSRECFAYTDHSEFIEKHLKPEPVIEVGIWVKAKYQSSKFMVFIESLEQPDKDDNSVKSYGFSKSGEWMDSELRCPIFLTNRCVKATPEEAKTRLIEEANRKGYRDGVKFRDLETGNIRTIRSNSFSSVTETSIHVSTPQEEWIVCNGISNPRIHDNGKWAEIIDEKAEIRESVARLEAELKDLKSKL